LVEDVGKVVIEAALKVDVVLLRVEGRIVGEEESFWAR
jgi:hypothetical protein